MRRRYASLEWWRVALRGRARCFVHSYTFRHPFVFEKSVEGEKFQFYVASSTGDEWYGPESDPFNIEMRFVRRNMVHEGMTVMECGGHHGRDTILLSRWVGPTGRVVVFEPLAENAAVIHANVGINGVSNVVVECAAVGSEPGEAVMKRAASNGSVRPHGGKGTTVPVVTIDDYCARTGCVPDLIKVDVEGFELSVLAGAESVLEKHRPALQIELHCDSLPKFGEDPENLWKYIDPTNYDVSFQPNDLAEPEPFRNQPLKGRVHLFFQPLEVPTADLSKR